MSRELDPGRSHWCIVLAADTAPEWMPYGSLELRSVPVQYGCLGGTVTLLQRALYLEHTERALEASSSTHFHEAIRAMQGQKVVCVHDVLAYGVTKVEAKAYESKLISESSLWPLGLNMKA